MKGRLLPEVLLREGHSRVLLPLASLQEACTLAESLLVKNVAGKCKTQVSLLLFSTQIPVTSKLVKATVELRDEAPRMEPSMSRCS